MRVLSPLPRSVCSAATSRNLSGKSLNYYPLLDEEALSDLERLANHLSGLKVVHLNATPIGGRVAEILRSLVPMMNGLGVQTDWYCFNADAEYFQVTKNIHNNVQGGS